MKHIVLLLLITAILANTLPRYLDIDFPREEGTYMQNGTKYYKMVIDVPYEKYEEISVNRFVYYVGQALSFVLILLAGYFKPIKDKAVDIVFELTLWLAISNLMDELFFDPVNLGLNEIVFAVLMIIYAIHRYKKYKNSDHNYFTNHK